MSEDTPTKYMYRIEAHSAMGYPIGRYVVASNWDDAARAFQAAESAEPWKIEKLLPPIEA